MDACLCPIFLILSTKGLFLKASLFPFLFQESYKDSPIRIFAISSQPSQVLRTPDNIHKFFFSWIQS